MNVADLLDLELLDSHIEQGLVRARRHPRLPLTIYNYAEVAVYTRAWDEVTLTCRGLVVADGGEILARPWRKWFNAGEHDDLDLSAPVEVTDKKDGSLAILLHYDGEPIIATRGSFESEQALHATELYRRQYDGRWEPKPDLTYLFEICYPANRIVIDYGTLDDLIHLGAVDIESGTLHGPRVEWPGPTVETFAHRTLGEALAVEPRKNAEGLVVRYLHTGQMIKIKQDDYVALHRIVTGLNARVVWEACMAEPDGLPALLEALPDEFQRWALDVGHDLQRQADAIEQQARSDYANIVAAVGVAVRKDFAIAAQASEHRALLFLLLDGKDIRSQIWKQIKPSGDYAPRTFTEDTA